MFKPKIDSQYFELAVQSVLYQYKDRLKHLEREECESFLKEVSDEVRRRASVFETITESVINDIGRGQNAV